MHRFPLPDDVEIETLIKQVYEAMLLPDQSRLSLIESQLLRKARKNKDQKTLNKIPWWIVLLLAGGFATAAWWAGEFGFLHNETGHSDHINEQNYNFQEGMLSNEQETRQPLSVQPDMDRDKQSPVIYQRENF